MKLWIWFLSGSIAGLMGASVLSPGLNAGVGTANAAEPVALRVLRGSDSSIGRVELREYAGGRFELYQDFNRCETSETEEGTESSCTQIAPAFYSLSLVSIEKTAEQRTATFRQGRGGLPMSLRLIEDLRVGHQGSVLEIEAKIPGVYGLFSGAARIEVQ